MNDLINDIVEKANKIKKDYSVSDFEIAKFVHIELGKIIYYDNNYTSKLEDNNKETDLSINRKNNYNKKTEMQNDFKQ